MTEFNDANLARLAPRKRAPRRRQPAATQSAGVYWLETATGKRLDLLNPDAEQICIDDIAWSLSRLPRFGGHTTHWEPLSVAVHAQWVAMYLWVETRSHTMALHGLLRDAHEAYTGNIPKPMQSMPCLRHELKRVQQRVQAAIYSALQLPPVTNEARLMIQRANEQALAIQARVFMPGGGRDWNLPEPGHTALSINQMVPIRPVPAYQSFMTTYKIFSAKLKRMH